MEADRGGTPLKISRGPDKEEKSPPPICMATPDVAEWASLLGEEGGLEEAVLAYWAEAVPLIFPPSRSLTARNVLQDELWLCLLGPLESLATGGASFASLAEQFPGTRPAGQICGHVFKNGELTFTCSDCANDGTCVMCSECFQHSAHRAHTYKMHASGGSGYCDCGDPEAWRSEPVCSLHNSAEETAAPAPELPPALRKALGRVAALCLRYATELLRWEGTEDLPSLVPPPALPHRSMPAQTVLFNDEHHTYDIVITALEKSISCKTEDAQLLASIIDKDGRTPVWSGAQRKCEEVQKRIRALSKQNSLRPDKEDSLTVHVLSSALVAHQAFAIRLLEWLTEQARTLGPLVGIIGGIVLGKGSGQLDPIATQMIQADAAIWKGGRMAWHGLLMGTVLMEMDHKVAFGRLFIQNYPGMLRAYVADDHEHGLSVVALGVQILTVPTIGRLLMAEEDALAVILRTLLNHFRNHIDANAHVFTFGTASFTFDHKRAIFAAIDAKYLLGAAPPPASSEDWEDGRLAKGFVNGIHALLAFLDCIQGMDAVKRHVSGHVEWEPEWESAFNIQLRLQSLISSVEGSSPASASSEEGGGVSVWTESVAGLLMPVVEETVRLLRPRLAGVPTVLVSVCGVSVVCVDFDVSTAPVSIHLPLTRLLPPFLLALKAQTGSLDSAGLPPWEALLEEPLRVLVLAAQIQAQMWRRNGYAVLNQLHNYTSPLCRVQMFDRDVLMIQLCGARIAPDAFLVRLLAKFGLRDWPKAAATAAPPAKGEDLAETRSLIESFLHLLVIVLSERWEVGVGVGVDSAAQLRRELVGLLCRGPRPFSKIEKYVPDTPQFARLNLEEACREVADFTTPTPTIGGRFELKKELRCEFSPFFYHYSRADVSAASEYLEKECKGDGVPWGPRADVPVFTAHFRPLLALFRSRLFVQLLRLTLEGVLPSSADFPAASRYTTEGHLHRALWLLSMGLIEETRSKTADTPTPLLKLSQLAAEAGLDRLLEQMEDKVEELALLSTHGALIGGVRRQLSAALRVSGPEPRVRVPSESPGVEGRAGRAKGGRAAALAQMAAMQQRFAERNKVLLAAHTDVGGEEEDEEVELSRLEDASAFPVAVGPARSRLLPPTPRRVLCILCSDSAQLSIETPPFVYAAFIQASSVFSSSVGEDGSGWEKCLLSHSDLAVGTHVSTCGHTLHLSCWLDYWRKEQERSDGRRRGLGDPQCGEYNCPLCKRLSNTILPVLPNPRALAAAARRPPGADESMDWDGEAPEPQLSFHAWLSLMRAKVVDGSEAFLRARPITSGDEEGTSRLAQRRIGVGGRFRQLLRVDSSSAAAGASSSDDEGGIVIDVDNDDAATWDGAVAVGGIGDRLGASSKGPYRFIQDFLSKRRGMPPNGPLKKFHELLFQLSVDIYERGGGALADTLATTRDMTPPLASFGLGSQALAFTLRATAAVLRYEGKPLFGALSSRHEAGLEALSRATLAQQLLNPKARRELRSALVAQLCLLLRPPSPERRRLLAETDTLSLAMGLLLTCRSAEEPEGRGTDVVEPVWDGAWEAHSLRLCLSAHLYQTLVSATINGLPKEEAGSGIGGNAASEILERLMSLLPLQPEQRRDLDLSALLMNVEASLCEFLGPIALFVQAASLTPPPEALKDPSIAELVPLCRYLGLPEGLGALLDHLELGELWASWGVPGRLRPFPVAPRLLVRLPKDFSELVQSAADFNCPSLAGKTGAERREATKCLICGVLVCSHSYCCQRPLKSARAGSGSKAGQVGGCTYHGHYCGAGTGLFLRIRESQSVLQWRAERGAHLPSPYVDAFGETDQYFRRGKPLFLNAELYRKLESMWLHHSVPEEIISRQETDFRLYAFDWRHF